MSQAPGHLTPKTSLFSRCNYDPRCTGETTLERASDLLGFTSLVSGASRSPGSGQVASRPSALWTPGAAQGSLVSSEGCPAYSGGHCWQRGWPDTHRAGDMGTAGPTLGEKAGVQEGAGPFSSGPQLPSLTPPQPGKRGHPVLPSWGPKPGSTRQFLCRQQPCPGARPQGPD